LIKLLEVIVNNLQDALEAQAGGADRLEVVRDLEQGGLTPDLELVAEIVAAVRIPVRAMVRENGSMFLASTAELDVLCVQAQQFNNLGVDGLVAGFILNGKVDLKSMRAITAAAPDVKVTFHRAFDELAEPITAIADLKTIPQVDRILTVGGTGTWSVRKRHLHQWQDSAAPQITILAGAGLVEAEIADVSRDPQIKEMHVGRAARIPQSTAGKVSRLLVAQLKGLSA